MSTAEILDEVNAVKSVIQLYIDGAAGDANLLDEAFHADARMFGHIGETRRDVAIRDFIEGVRSADRKLSGQRYRSDIMDIKVTGKAAAVTLVEEDYRGCDFINFFTLCKIDMGWRIVSKTFTCTGGDFK